VFPNEKNEKNHTLQAVEPVYPDYEVRPAGTTNILRFSVN
jgi:hypothetical protein